jgi:hypothetical protein
MKLKALLLAVLVAGVGASFALADDGGAGGTTTTTTPAKLSGHRDCRRIELRGTLASTSGTSFAVDVEKANNAGAALEGTQATVAVAAKARVRWEGVGTFAGPATGDRVKVVAAQCSATGNVLTAFVVDVRVAAGPAADKKGAPARAVPTDKAKADKSGRRDDSGESKTESVHVAKK